MSQPRTILDQQYRTEVHRYWRSSAAPPELLAALDDGWLGTAGRALDLGCGLGAELARLAKRSVALTVGVDRSSVDRSSVDRSSIALDRARQPHPAVRFMDADVPRLPFGAQSFDFALDRGSFHYLRAADRPSYATEVLRVLRPGGRFLLRACLCGQGPATT